MLYVYLSIYICIYIYIKLMLYVYIYIYKHINFSQTCRLFSKPSTLCVDKALDEKFTDSRN